MNQCHFLGRLTRDPDLRTTQSGKSVVNFGIAVNRYFGKGEGADRPKEVSFLEMEAWDTGAETIAKYLVKGDPIIVHCSIKQEEWEDKDGKKRSKLKFRVNSFDFVGGKKDKPQKQESQNEPEPADEESSIPF